MSRAGRLLNVVPGRCGAKPMGWLAGRRGVRVRHRVRHPGSVGPLRRVFEIMVPDATLVADPFHVIKLANTKLDECRRRVQNETLGHRGRKTDPLYRCRRLLTKAKERLDERARRSSPGLLRAGDPRATWPPAGKPRKPSASSMRTATRTRRRVGDSAGDDLMDKDYPIEARSLGRTLIRWKHQIAAWHHAHVSNGPTEASTT